MNWFKGKQIKHVQEMDLGQKRAGLGTIFCTFTSLTITQPSLVSPVHNEQVSIKFNALSYRIAGNRRSTRVQLL